MNWNTVCTPKKEEGLGLRPHSHTNDALLGKWLWRLGEENSLCRQIIVAKYSVVRNGRNINEAPQDAQA